MSIFKSIGSFYSILSVWPLTHKVWPLGSKVTGISSLIFFQPICASRIILPPFVRQIWIFDDFSHALSLYIAAAGSYVLFLYRLFTKNSGNTSISHNFNMLQAISTKLGHNNNDHLPFMPHYFQGSKGHTKVTGVKSVICYKKFQLQNDNSDLNQTWSQEPLRDWLQNLSNEKNLRDQMGHFRVKFENIFKKSLKIAGRC